LSDYGCSVTERGWLLRDQVLRVIGESPAPPATWVSVVRRTVIVVGFFVAGLVQGNLSTTVLCAFGALQLALIEAAVTRTALVRLLLGTVFASVLSVWVAMCVGGTWWVVPLIAALAYVFGCTSQRGAAPATIGTSALALAVIFAGMPRPPEQALQAAGWLAVGALTQAVAWVIAWKYERRVFARRAVALKILSLDHLVRKPSLDTRALSATHDASDTVSAVLATACFPADEEQYLRRVHSDAVATTRALTAWMVLRSPGDGDRIHVSLMLRRIGRILDDQLLRKRPRSVDIVATDEWVSSREVARSLTDLAASASGVMTGRAVSDSRPLLLPARPPAVVRGGVKVVELIESLNPRSVAARHGFRMAIGLALAEALTLVLPFAHSFWLPLSVVFTLKADWSFTVVRGLNRIIGNLAAVIVLPALLMAFGYSSPTLALALAVLTAVACRYFFGNYVVASFGLAGSVLILDYTLDPSDSLFVTRIAATALGSLIAVLVALAFPAWVSSRAEKQVADVAQSLQAWSADVSAAIEGAGDCDRDRLEEDINRSRLALGALEPTAGGALFEPRPQADPVALMLIYESGVRLAAGLTALTSCIALPGGVGSLRGSEFAALTNELVQLERTRADHKAALSRFAAGQHVD